ncbi:hypothetical protein [Jiangella alba]|uniref:hypothetical protein n=1 Tax=Jiangella alba TaxID=561176 RepID=UPI00083EED46|nr:hypothetical protein [Jiangella alba]
MTALSPVDALAQRKLTEGAAFVDELPSVHQAAKATRSRAGFTEDLPSVTQAAAASAARRQQRRRRERARAQAQVRADLSALTSSGRPPAHWTMTASGVAYDAALLTSEQADRLAGLGTGR